MVGALGPVNAGGAAEFGGERWPAPCCS
jgi:hypothetical protein